MLVCASFALAGRRLPRNAFLALSLDDVPEVIPVRPPHHVRGMRYTWVYDNPSPTGATARFTVRGRWGRGGRRVVAVCGCRQDATGRRSVRRLVIGESTVPDGIRARVVGGVQPPVPVPALPGSDLGPGEGIGSLDRADPIR